MRFINEKGKLFGIINIIDFGAILLVLLILGALVYNFIGSDHPIIEIKEEKNPTATVYVKVKCPMKPASYVKALKRLKDEGTELLVGNKILEGADLKIHDVTDQPADDIVKTADGQIVVTKHPYLFDIYVVEKFQAEIDPDDVAYKLGTQELRIGNGLSIKAKNLEIIGTIEDIYVE